MTVLQFFKFTPQGRFPTLPEMRNHAWMAIAEGAGGLCWWNLGVNGLKDVCAGWCAEKTGYMNNLKTVINEIAALEPVLLADDAPGGARRAIPTPGAIRTKVKMVNGRGYVFAYNTTSTAAERDLHLEYRAGDGHGQCREPDALRLRHLVHRLLRSLSGPRLRARQRRRQRAGRRRVGSGYPDSGAGAPTVAFVNPAEGATVSQTGTVTLAAAGGTGNYTYILAVNGTGVYTGTNRRSAGTRRTSRTALSS